MARRRETPSQTAGPYLHIGCMPNAAGIAGVYAEDPGSRMMTADAGVAPILFRGCIFDGTGAVVTDALVEIWQADARGALDPTPAFTGWGRSGCTDGEFRFETLKPGRVPWRDGTLQAPHISLWIAARGINLGLHTRAYFADEEEANAADPILSRIEHRARVTTLMAAPEPGGYRFDIRLQGDGETVFFDI